MKLLITTEPGDVEAVRQIVVAQDAHQIIRARREMRPYPPHERSFWRAMLMCLLTTQNKSGRGSPVDSFLNQKPFPLTVAICRTNRAQLGTFIYAVFEQTDRRMRRWKRIAEAAAHNFAILESGLWTPIADWAEQLWEQRNQTADPKHHQLEREAAVFLQKNLEGLGPKQSRNFWQSLGLTRYEIPLDSRLLKWCRANLGVTLPTGALADEAFYSFVMDAIRDLCTQAGEWPSVFDGAVFSSYEGISATVAAANILGDEDAEGEDL